MNVRELKRMLERHPDDAEVEFEDKTYGRICPTNSSYLTSREGKPIIRICNVLGEHKA